MKQLLSLLMCFVLLHTQAFAIAGGPTYASTINPFGTYAGVMIPETKITFFDNPAVEESLETDANSLGIFVLNVPQAGATVGNFLYFDEGEAFFGTIQGATDTENAEIKALLVGVALGNKRDIQTEDTDVAVANNAPVNAVGKIECELVPSGITGGARVVGEAYVQNQAYVSRDGVVGLGLQKEVTFVVDGFQQSFVTSGATLTAPSTTGSAP